MPRVGFRRTGGTRCGHMLQGARDTTRERFAVAEGAVVVQILPPAEHVRGTRGFPAVQEDDAESAAFTVSRSLRNLGGEPPRRGGERCGGGRRGGVRDVLERSAGGEPG